jgi:hypothetical protein
LRTGGSDVREVQQHLNPEAEHYLDWFHLTMQITVMGQYAKGREMTPEKRDEALKLRESVKHYLWHGNVARARGKLEDLHDLLDHCPRSDRWTLRVTRISPNAPPPPQFP